MNKRLFIVHGWSGSPNEPLISWLGKKGIELGYETTVLDMPSPDVPTIDAWIKHLDENVMYVDENTNFIGHSIGCQAIIRYLATNMGSKVGKVVLIAPWGAALTGIDEGEDADIARPWKENPIDFATVKNMGKDFVAIFSDNDPYVPMEPNRNLFENKLNARIIVENGKGHLTESDGVIELQSAIDIFK